MKIVNDTFSCGIRTVVAQPEGVCSQMVELKLFGDEIQDVRFYGGCSGNLKGIAALCRGQKVSECSSVFPVSHAVLNALHALTSWHSF